MKRRDWFVTASGKRVHVLEPDPELICIEDVAHALALTCRFGGHCETFYSVAQHSVHVSMLVPQRLAKAALLHDATEAYLGDVIRPLKRELGNYASIEASWEIAVRARFGLEWLTIADDCEIKRADLVALATERRDLLPSALSTVGEWLEDELGAKPDPREIAPLEWCLARRWFLMRWEEVA